MFVIVIEQNNQLITLPTFTLFQLEKHEKSQHRKHQQYEQHRQQQYHEKQAEEDELQGQNQHQATHEVATHVFAAMSTTSCAHFVSSSSPMPCCGGALCPFIGGVCCGVGSQSCCPAGSECISPGSPGQAPKCRSVAQQIVIEIC